MMENNDCYHHVMPFFIFFAQHVFSPYIILLIMRHQHQHGRHLDTEKV